MTDALYSRIEAIESFAADVAHELKNLLTSLRSAVETLPLAQTEEAQPPARVIQHDVKRLDRLISDISDASRLDAEMQRHEAQPVDLTKLLNTVVSVANEVRHDDGVLVSADISKAPGQRLRGARPRSAARTGDRQPDRQCPLVLAARRHGADHVPSVKNEVEIVVDDTARASDPEAGEDLRALLHPARIRPFRPEFRDWASRSPSRSSRHMTAAFWVEASRSSAPPGETPVVLGARFIVRLPAI